MMNTLRTVMVAPPAGGGVMEGRCVEHAEKHRHAAILVRDDREVHLRLPCLIDVRDPARMVLGAVDAQADDPLTRCSTRAALAVAPNSVVPPA